jgi:Sterol carrier protein domain
VRDGVGEVVGNGARTEGAKTENAVPVIHLAVSTLGSIVAAGLRPSDGVWLGLVRADAAALAVADALFGGPRFQCLDPF